MFAYVGRRVALMVPVLLLVSLVVFILIRAIPGDAVTLMAQDSVAPLTVVATAAFGGAIVAEAGLSFVGLGIPLPDPSWGNMMSGPARTYIARAPWMAFFPGLFLSLLVFGINMLGDALRDVFDPRLRKR